MTVVLIVLCVLALLVLLALLPIGVSLRYNEDGFSVRCLLGWIPIPIDRLIQKILNSQKTSEKKSTSEKVTKKTKSKTEKPKEEKGGSILDFLPFIQLALDYMNAFRRKLRIRHLQMKLIMAGDDPCDLAINYGRAWIALDSLMPQLERCFVIKERDLEVECDFETSKTLLTVRVDAVISLGGLVWICLRYGIKALKIYFNIQNSRKGGGSNEQKSS